MIYVRREDSDTWHWNKRCRGYPVKQMDWATARIALIRESLGKAVVAEVKGTGPGGRVMKPDLVRAGILADKLVPVKIIRTKPTTGELCNECLAKAPKRLRR